MESNMSKFKKMTKHVANVKFWEKKKNESTLKEMQSKIQFEK